MRWIPLAATLGLAGLISACGSSTQSGTGGPTTTAPATSTASVPPSSSSTQATTTSQRCSSTGLRAKVTDAGDGAAATRYLVIQATNIGQVPCSTGGYFGVSSFDPVGHVIATQDARQATGPTSGFSLAPGGSLSFVVGLDDLPSGPQGTCPRVGAFHLVPPDEAQYLQLSLLNAQGQGTQVVECPGPIVVRPVTPAA